MLRTKTRMGVAQHTRTLSAYIFDIDLASLFDDSASATVALDVFDQDARTSFDWATPLANYFGYLIEIDEQNIMTFGVGPPPAKKMAGP